MIKFFEKDPYSPIQYVYEVEKILYKGKSSFQEIMVFENSYFGKVLVLDNVVQLTERDEFIYHEMLTHVLMHSHPEVKTVAVIGGGDGCAVREILKHDCVEKLYFIEIDEEVIKTSKKFFPSISSAIDDPRVEIKCMDGAEFIKAMKNSIDVIIVDSTDIIGFAKSLFTVEFFKSAREALTEKGMFVTLSESLLFHKELVYEVQNSMRLIFPIVDLYTASIATYAGNWWTFSVGSKSLCPREIRKPVKVSTKFYSEELHKNCFLPKEVYKKLMNKELLW
jgi:spermidine synthase